MLKLKQRLFLIFALQAKQYCLSNSIAYLLKYKDLLAKDAAAKADLIEFKSLNLAKLYDQAIEKLAVTLTLQLILRVKEKTKKLLNKFLKQNIKVNIINLIKLCFKFAIALESYIANIKVKAKAVFYINKT